LTNEDREDLAWVMCVLLMATRQLALVNKTGQVNFEINAVCRMFVEWIRNIIQQHFMPFFSAMLFLSYDRVIVEIDGDEEAHSGVARYDVYNPLFQCGVFSAFDDSAHNWSMIGFGTPEGAASPAQTVTS
jgi:hypothetical protein